MRKDRVIRLRCTQAEYEAWSKIAEAAKVTLSDLVRASIGVGPPPTRPVGMVEQAVVEAESKMLVELAKIPLLQTEATSPNPFRKPKRKEAKYPPRCSCFDCVRERKLGGGE